MSTDEEKGYFQRALDYFTNFFEDVGVDFSSSGSRRHLFERGWNDEFRHSPYGNSPLGADDFLSMLLNLREQAEKEKAARAEQEEEGSLDTDPDLTDGDDDLQNGTVPDPSDNFNESLRANVDAALEAFNQLITQLEERGAPEEEIETLRNAFTAVYPPTPTQQGGPIDLGTLPVIPNLSGPSAVLTVENGLDDIFVELKIDLPIIGPLLESLGLGDEGKIHLRRGGRWEQPNDVLENVGGIFTDILKIPESIIKEATTIIEGIEDGTVFEGVKKGEGLFADLLKKWLTGRYPWLEDEWFKDFIKQSEELARQSGLLTLSELDTEEKCNATGTHIWDDTTKSCKEAEPKEVTEDVVPPPEKTEEECLAEGNAWDGEKCVFVPEDEKKAKCLARGDTWENGQCTPSTVDPQQVCAQRGGRWDPLANNGEGDCITDDGGGGDDDPACENGTYNKTLERCECNFGWVESTDGQSCEKVVCDETTEQLSEDGKSCVLKPTTPDCGGNGTYNETSQMCECNFGWKESTDGQSCEKVVCDETKEKLSEDGKSCVLIDDGGGGGGNPACENGKYNETLERCECNFGWKESTDGQSCEKVVCDETKEKLSEDGKSCVLIDDGGGGGGNPACENGTYDPDSDECVCNTGYTFARDGETGVPFCKPDDTTPQCTLPNTVWSDEAKDCVCKDGYENVGENGELVCQLIDGGGGGGGPVTPQCPANATWDTNLDDCVCNAGFTKSADGKSCVPDGLPPSGTCPAGQVKDPETGECVDAPPPPTSGGGGGGGMFSSQPVNPAGGINYALPTFVNVAYEPKDYVASLNNVIQESLFEGMI